MSALELLAGSDTKTGRPETEGGQEVRWGGNSRGNFLEKEVC